MAPFGALSTLFASLFIAAVTATLPNEFDLDASVVKFSNSPNIPNLKMLDSVYDSTYSSAGFMFDIKAKNSIVIYGLDVNMIPASLIRGGPETRVKVYTKSDTFQGSKNSPSNWDLWIDTTIVSKGLNQPTSIPQLPEATDTFQPIVVGAKEKRAFYVAFEGPYLRYSDATKLYYINEDAFIYGSGAAKRKDWDGGMISPRTFNGALHYYVGNEVLTLPVDLLPNSIISEEPTSSPIESPTLSPTISVEPTISPQPTNKPTAKPTPKPTLKPTQRPTRAPIPYDLFSTKLEDSSTKPVLVYAGFAFDIKGRDDIEISSIGFNTYLTSDIKMQLYIRDGGYKGYEDDISAWTHVATVTVQGQGMGNPTYLPQKSFEPFILRKQQRMGIYLTTDGPYLRASKGDVEGKPHAANPQMVLYQGVGKRYPMASGTISPRIFNGAFGYVSVDIPTPSPTINTDDLWVANHTFVPVADTYIQKGKFSTFGDKAQLMVDGAPERVSLIKFDISILNGNTRNEPEQVLSAVLRLYSMTESDFGGFVSVIPDGHISEERTTWGNSQYGEQMKGTPMGQFRSIWQGKYYEIDITEAFRDGPLPKALLVRLSSDSPNGIIYRSRDGNSENGPRLLVKFAYEPDTKPLLAQMFGSDPPTLAPTIKPEWEDAIVPPNPARTYFNYNPQDWNFGPGRWNRMQPDGYYDGLRRLKTDTRRNRCLDGRRQSPRNLCETSDKCLEFHETRPRAGQYGLGSREDSQARPTPHIMHNKLRLTYKERRSEFEEPIPPGADFARNGLNSGIQDLVNIDFKVRSEHRLCGKQYDGEMQLYYLHKYGNLEAIGILFEADAEKDNDHFQILLNYFQQKFDGDARTCQRRRRRARALFEKSRGTTSRTEEDEIMKAENTKLRGSSPKSPSSSNIVEDMVDEQEFDQEIAEEDNEPSTPEDDDVASSPSLASTLYNKIHDGLLSLVQRREARDIRWDPLKPWDIYRSVHFWSYAGSTTEPPCFEDVKWRVTDVPFHISPTQYIQLKKLMFDHLDPDTCRKTSSHFDESNARPVQPYRGGATYRCRRSDYASDVERAASGRVKGFVLREKWWGVDNWPYVEPEFPNV